MNSRTLITTLTAFAIASSAFAYRAPSGTNYRSQPRLVDHRGSLRNDPRDLPDRDLKQAIKTKRKQVKQFRKSGDPRAAQAEQELGWLQDQRQQSHVEKHHSRNQSDRVVGRQDDRDDRDDDRHGDRVRVKQRKENERDHDDQDDDHDDDENDQDH